MSQSSTALFQDAFDQGDLTAGSLQVIGNIGAHFAAVLGTPAEEVEASEVTIFNLKADNTGSVSPFVGEIVSGQNDVIDALLDSKQGSSVMMSTSFFNATLHPFVMLDQATRMDTHNYRADMGRTPLYDQTLEMLAATLAKTLEFASNGVPVRSVSCIITDGGDNSSKHRAADVNQVVEDMLRQENHIIAAMGIDDGYTDFNAVFAEMGIPKQWILTPSTDASSLRQAFAVISQSAVRASQGAASFSSTALGGFGS